VTPIRGGACWLPVSGCFGGLVLCGIHPLIAVETLIHRYLEERMENL